MIKARTPPEGDPLSGAPFFKNVINAQCRICRTPIGYDSEFSLDPESVGAFIHADECMDKLIAGEA